MQIVFHIGAHFTDEDRLIKGLLKNKGVLAQQGISVPGPSRYRKLLRQASFGLKGGPAPAGLREELLQSILEGQSAQRVVFSAPTLICAPFAILKNGAFYERIGERVAALTQLFPGDQHEVFLALRNPATLLQAIPEALDDKAEFMHALAGIDPRGLRWSDVVARIKGENPTVPLTVWCNEDTPLIWPQVLAELSGHDPGTTLRGTDDLLASIMTPQGLERMRGYLRDNPPATEIQRRRIVAAFLDKFAIPDQIEVELDLPGWTHELVDQITELYEEDMFQIEKLPGVDLIAP